MVSAMGDRIDFTAPEPRLSPDRIAALHRLAEILERSGIDLADLDQVGRIDKIHGGVHETAIKLTDPDTGEQRVEKVQQERAGWVISPSWDTGPQWPLVQPGPEYRIEYQNASDTGTDTEGWRTAVIIPDMQCPFEDVAAVSAAIAIVAAVQPDIVVMNGDNIDAPDAGKYRKYPSFAGALQTAIDSMTLYCAELRAAAGPDADIYYLEGNHDARLQNMILDNAAAAFGIRVGKLPDEDPHRPVLSVPSLLRLDEAGVEYVPGYPAGAVWLTDNFRVIHGDKTSKNAANEYLNEGTSVAYGHTHHRAWVERVQPNGRRIFAVSAGCLARLDGGTPGVKSGYDEMGEPVKSHTNWDHGVLVVRMHPEYGEFPEMVPIYGGQAFLGGQVIAG